MTELNKDTVKLKVDEEEQYYKIDDVAPVKLSEKLTEQLLNRKFMQSEIVLTKFMGKPIKKDLGQVWVRSTDSGILIFRPNIGTISHLHTFQNILQAFIEPE